MTILLVVMSPRTALASVFRNFIHTYTNTTTVGTVYVDDDGTAWIGTSSGIMRYDDLKRNSGVRLAVPEQLCTPIHLIYGMKDKRLLVITRGMKRYLFNPSDFSIEEINHAWLAERGINAPGEWAIDIISTPGALALIAWEGKIYTYDESAGAKARLLADLGERITCLSADDSHYHIVTASGLYTYNISSGRINRVDKPFDTFAAHVLMDPAGNIWLGDTNLYLYDSSAGSWKTLRENLAVTEITKSGPDIYVGTSTSGILHFTDGDNPADVLKNDPCDINTPVSDHCAMVYVDKDDNLWVTYSKCDLSISSHYYDMTKARHIQPLLRKNIKDDIISLLPQADGSIILGTDGTGLFQVNPDTGYETVNNPVPAALAGDKVITAIFSDSRNRMWIGSYRTGLVCLHDGKSTRILKDTSPYSIVEDCDGNIFVGTSGNGLFRIDADMKEPPVRIGLDNEMWIQQLECRQTPTVYAATASSRFFSVDAHTLKVKEIPYRATGDDGKPAVPLQSFVHDSRSLLWSISDAPGGHLHIHDLTNDSTYSITALSGIRFRSLIEDNNKNMWLASDNAIYNIVPQYDPAGRTYSFRHHVYHIRSNEGSPIKYNYRAVAKLPDGRLVFGGMNGYQIVNPDQYQKLGLMSKPKGLLSDLIVSNSFAIPGDTESSGRITKQNIAHSDHVSLAHNRNNINVLFSPRDYDSPFKTDYYYRLDSTKNEWRPITSNMIELLNLPPGDYRLEICAMLPEGIMSDTIDSIDIEICPPWYRTAWAYTVYVIALILVITLVFYYFSDRQKQKLRVAQAEKEVARQHQLNEMKLRFFTNISHDFRTPLSLIITPLESYLASHHDKDTRHLLAPVHKNAVRLLNLVNQILDFRKLEVTGMPLHLSYGDIVGFVKEICASFTLFSEDTGIKLDVDSDINMLNMYFDKDKLGKIMMNLLSNAFKYTERDGRVCVTIRRVADSVEISVADTGKGIPDTDKAHVFDRFYQSGASPHSTMGCGIGLHIVKEFVLLHKGTVAVADNTPAGTVFTVTLPVVKSTETPAGTGQDADTAPLPPVPKTHDADSDTHTTRPTILLVEDNPDFINYMALTLSGSFNVLKSANGKEAMQILCNENVDIIISDVMMEQMDGLELCHAVKSDIRTSHIPFVLLTARSLAEDEMKGLESGADDYVTKPFSMPILLQRISKLLDDSRRSRDRFRRVPDIAPSEVTITPLDEQFLSEAIRVVEENMSNPDFSVEMLSSSLGMHRTHLYKKLSCITGKTPIEFIRLIRLKRALQYLGKSQMYISEIAYKVGFNNPRLLSKYFKEEFNMTPREYVKSLGLDNDPGE